MPARQSRDGHNLIVFDGTCVFCSGFARFVAKADRADRFRFVTAHSPLGTSLYETHGIDHAAMETNIVIVDGEARTKVAGFSAAMTRLGWPWKALSVLGLLPQAPLNWVYDRIARNRYRIAGKQVCPVPTPALRARLIE